MDSFNRLLGITLFLAVLTVCLSVETEPGLYLPRGSKGIIECNFEKKIDKRCRWSLKDDDLINSDDKPGTHPGYSIDRSRNDLACDLTIDVVRWNDTGKWGCSASGQGIKHFTVVAGVKPQNQTLVQDDKTITPSEYIKKYKVVPDAKSGNVTFKCVSRAAFPAPVITWEVAYDTFNGTQNDTDEDDKTHTVDSTSIFTLKFPMDNETKLLNKENCEKTVTCVIKHPGFGKKIRPPLRAIFVREYPVTEAHLATKQGTNEVTLRCSADGFPEPTYQIQEVNPATNRTIGEPTLAEILTVKKDGTYRCTATNTVNTKVHSVSKDLTVTVPNSGVALKPAGMILAVSLLVIALTRVFGSSC